jgi:hypothetical protein
MPGLTLEFYQRFTMKIDSQCKRIWSGFDKPAQPHNLRLQCGNGRENSTTASADYTTRRRYKRFYTVRILLSQFCAEENLFKHTSDRLIVKIKRRDFVREDIHAELIREMDRLVTE